MALKTLYTDLSNIGEQSLLRLDVNYRYFFDIQQGKVWSNSTVLLCDTIKCIDSKKVDKGELEDDAILIDLSNIERRFDNLTELNSVSHIGSDKSLIGKGDIVIPKIQPRMCNIFTNVSHSEYLASTELVEYTCINNTNVKFLFYLLCTREFSKCLSYTESGKTHRRVNPSELLKYKIPNVSSTNQDKAALRISTIERRINKLKLCVKKEQTIINDHIVQLYKLNEEELHNIDRNKYFQISSSNIGTQNLYLRSSSRWNKLQLIQEEMFSSIDDSANLGELMINEGTKNGWSPECSEFDGSYKVLGIDAISKSGVLSLDNPKFTDQTRNNIDDFVIRKGDFFVSRGNTVDLVALASIAQEIDNDEEYIFPDLMIRIKVDETRIDKEYLAYIFNSIVGRMYFKYAAKGKQQSMVKVSSEELKQFRIPMIDIDKQRELVRKIKAEINKQDKKKVLIAKLRNEIDDIIYRTIGVSDLK